MRYLADREWLFLHVPKVAGCTIEKWLDDMSPKPIKLPHRWNTGRGNYGRLPGRHVLKEHFANMFPDIPIAVTVMFVRHPVTWWISTWRHLWDVRRRRERRGSDLWGSYRQYSWHPHKPMALYLTEDFEEFVRTFLSQHPGYLSDIYNQYFIGADIIGRLETLRTDFELLFGNSFEDVRNNPSREPKPEVSQELETWICQQEAAAVSQFYSIETVNYRRKKDWNGYGQKNTK